MAKSLIGKNQLHPDLADLVSGYGSDFFVSQQDFQTIGLGSIVYTTGDQIINGVKNFLSRPQVSGLNVLIEGDIAAGGGTIENAVYTTGNQNISGVKTFLERPSFNGTGLATLADVNEGGATEYLFPSDLNVILGGGKTFGRFRNGDTIPAAGKTTYEVLGLAINEIINPTISPYSVSPTSILIGQTSIINTITFSGQILNPDATLSVSRLEWRRGTSDPFQTLEVNPTSPYIHVDTNTVSNTNSYNYRYIIGDSAEGLTTGSALNIPFLYGNYFGYSGVESLTSVQDIEALGNIRLSDSRARTISNVTAGAELYFYYAYRSGAGNLTSVIQDGATTIFINGEGAFINQGTIAGTNVNGINVIYRVYRSVDPGAFSSNTLVFN
jgi:hypothetical protein